MLQLGALQASTLRCSGVKYILVISGDRLLVVDFNFIIVKYNLGTDFHANMLQQGLSLIHDLKT